MGHFPSLLVDCRVALGEGLLWHQPSACWLWTDIEGATIWRHHPETGQTRTCRLRDRTGAFTVAQSGRLLLGLTKGLEWAWIDWETGEVACEPVATVAADAPSVRINDGRTDRAGNFVFGTMSEAAGHPPTAHFYQYSRRHGLRRLDLGAVGIANSICFSPSGSVMYFCDSMQRRIMHCRYDPDSARVSDVTPLVALPDGGGMPDGSVVDADGTIWNAAFGGAVVRRYSPVGDLLAESAVPADNVTCPAFGGPDLTQLAVTTARIEVSEAQLAERPETGGVFMVDAHGARGLADPVFDDR